MIGFLSDWVTAVTGAALLTAIALTITPKGSAYRVVQLVCGVVLVLAVLTPVGRLLGRNTDLRFDLPVTDKSTARLYEAGQSAVSALIRERTSAYIENQDEATVEEVNKAIDRMVQNAERES